jgi:hypothetical protein
MRDEPQGRTILGRCSGGLRLVGDRVRSFEWESYSRGEPKAAARRWRDRRRGRQLRRALFPILSFIQSREKP